MNAKLLIRVDINNEIGFGDLYCCSLHTNTSKK